MFLTHFCNTCYLLRNLYFFLLLGYYPTVSRKVFFTLVTAIFVVNVFQLYLAIGWSCQCNIFMVHSNNERKLPANNQNLERTPLNIYLKNDVGCISK